MIEKVRSKCNQIHMKIWNSKFGSSLYFEFEVKSIALSEVNLGQTIYHFEVWEAKSPTF